MEAFDTMPKSLKTSPGKVHLGKFFAILAGVGRVTALIGTLDRGTGKFRTDFSPAHNLFALFSCYWRKLKPGDSAAR